MPRNEFCPNFALLSGFDARAWANVSVFSRGGTPVAVTTTGGDEVYLDAVQFLNNHGSRLALVEDLQNVSDAAGAFGTWEIGIDTDDRVYINNDTFAFALQADTDNLQLGFSNAVLVASLDAVRGGYTAVAQSDWIRGQFKPGDMRITLPPPGFGTTLNFGISGIVQDVPIYLREAGSVGDLDDMATGDIQAADNAALGVSTTRWGVTDEGHVFTSYLTATGGVTWIDTDFRDRLGFTGDEVAVVDGAYSSLTAEYPLPGALFPTRPYNVIRPVSETTATTLDLTDGTVASNYVTTLNRWFVEAFLDGPADDRDLHRHWHFNCKQYLYPGARATVYQDWGDSRRSGWRQQYGLLYTPEHVTNTDDEGGYRGRIIGSLRPDISVTDTTWPNRIRQRSPFNFTLQVDPTV